MQSADFVFLALHPNLDVASQINLTQYQLYGSFAVMFSLSYLLAEPFVTCAEFG